MGSAARCALCGRARFAWGIRYHGPLRFYADDANVYECPEMYNRIWGEDYEPLPYIREAYEFARNHRWYMESRLITVNDNYSSDATTGGKGCLPESNG